MLPWRQAFHLPFIFYGKVRFVRTNGKIIFSNSIALGTIRIGSQGCEMFPNRTSVIDIGGTLKIDGASIRLGAGSILRIENTGTILLKDKCRIGANTILFSENLIEIGENTGVSWNCQLMDTDTHSIQDIATEHIKARSAPIIIGKHCWIGNHVIINKGTILPDYSTIASLSLCNKNYTGIAPSFSILGGIPAKVLAYGKRRMDDKL